MVADSNFISNVAISGGGIDTEFLTSVVCCNFMENRATAGDGGGLHGFSQDSITISYSNFLNNTASHSGGGARLDTRGTDNVSVYITGSAFTDNTASQGHGGGVYYRSSGQYASCLLYTSPSPRDATLSRMPSSA